MSQSSPLLQEITPAQLAELAQQAEQAPRRRAHRLLHQSHAEVVQRLLIAVASHSYFRPHRHPAAVPWEMLLPLQGELDLLLFDEDGQIESRHRLGGDQGLALVDVPAQRWHSLYCPRPCLLLEIKPGPYVPERYVEFAPWAPAEESPQVADYFAGLAG